MSLSQCSFAQYGSWCCCMCTLPFAFASHLYTAACCVKAQSTVITCTLCTHLLLFCTNVCCNNASSAWNSKTEVVHQAVDVVPRVHHCIVLVCDLHNVPGRVWQHATWQLSKQTGSWCGLCVWTGFAAPLASGDSTRSTNGTKSGSVIVQALPIVRLARQPNQTRVTHAEQVMQCFCNRSNRQRREVQWVLHEKYSV